LKIGSDLTQLQRV